MKLQTIILDNNIEYNILDKLEIHKNIYFILVELNSEKILILKQNIIDNEIYLEKLNNIQELNEVFKAFYQKYPNLKNHYFE